MSKEGIPSEKGNIKLVNHVNEILNFHVNKHTATLAKLPVSISAAALVRLEKWVSGF